VTALWQQAVAHGACSVIGLPADLRVWRQGRRRPFPGSPSGRRLEGLLLPADLRRGAGWLEEAAEETSSRSTASYRDQRLHDLTDTTFRP